MPAPSKSLKMKLFQLKNQAHVLGVLARSINAVENCLTETNRKENMSDTDFLREMLFEEANSIYSRWYNSLKSHQILTVMNKTLDDAGWDYTTFCVNHDADDGYLLTWHAEE
jgi:hypothetical protein